MEANGFSMAIQALEIVKEYIKSYDPKMKQIFLPNQSILFLINKDLIQSTFGVPMKEEYCDIYFDSSTFMFNKKKTLRREDM